MNRLALLFCMCAAQSILPSAAKDNPDTLTPGQALDYVRAGDLHFSPDG